MVETPSRRVTFASRTVEAGMATMMKFQTKVCHTRGYDDPECSARENWNLDLSKAASMFLVVSAIQVSYLCPLFICIKFLSVMSIFFSQIPSFTQYCSFSFFTRACMSTSVPTALVIGHQSTQITESFENSHRNLRAHLFTAYSTVQHSPSLPPPLCTLVCMYNCMSAYTVNRQINMK